MERNKSEFLTQDGLVAELHKLGYSDVTKRRVASWRANDLLPSFYMIGGGRGQRRGRESSAWAHREEVVNQAAWVYELLKIYKGVEDIHLPLWMLGFRIPLARVREALSRPLNSMVHSIETEIGNKGELEDAIGQAAYEFTKDMQRANVALLQVPRMPSNPLPISSSILTMI
jgi:hypothetical protein